MHRLPILLAALVLLASLLACSLGKAIQSAVEPTATGAPTQEPAWTQAPSLTQAPTEVPTLAPAATETPSPTDTPAPSETSTLEPTGSTTFSSAEAATAIPGFAKVTGKGMEIYLPDTFVGGNLDNDLDVIIATLKKMGGDVSSYADQIEKNRDSFALWAFDTKRSDPNYLTNVNVISQSVPSTLDLQTIVDQVKSVLPQGAKITAEKTVTLNGYEMERMTVDMQVATAHANEVVYLVKDDGKMWMVTFSTSPSEFTKREAVFDQCMSTFRSTTSGE
jgi:hypothetical protein